MKRKDAEAKIVRILERLDAKITEPEVIIEEVYLFGSMLTDKAEPNDIDIAVKYRRSAEHLKMRCGWPGAIEAFKKIRLLAAGMKKVSIHESGELSEGNYPSKLIWPK